MEILKEKGKVTLTRFPFNRIEQYRVMVKGDKKNTITYHLVLANAEREFEKLAA